MPAMGLAAHLAHCRAAPLGVVLAVPVPTLLACHKDPWVLSRAMQGDSLSLLPRPPCLANVPQGIPGAGAQGWLGLGTAAGQACSSL